MELNVNDKIPKYFMSQLPVEQFKGALLDLKLVLRTADYFIGEIKRKSNEWNFEQAKVILYEMYNISRVVKHEAGSTNFDDKLKSYNTVLVGSITRNLMDGLININYLLEKCDSDLEDIKKEVWFYKLERKRLMTVESYGKISERLFKLKERVNSTMEELSENSLLIKIKGSKQSVLDFLNNGEEKIFKKKEILKNYNQEHFNSINLHLSQFVHFTAFGINQSRKDIQTINQITKFMAVMVQHNSIVLAEAIGLINKSYNLKLNEGFKYYYKIYHHFLTDTRVLINPDFEDYLNANEEKEFMNAMNEYINYRKQEALLNRNSLFFFLSDNNFELYNEELTHKFYQIRSLKNGIYYLAIPQTKNEVLVVFKLRIETGEIKEIKYIKNT